MKAIAAIAENGVIGLDNSLPWRLKKDLKRFRKLTSEQTDDLPCAVVMGFNTWKSLPKGYLPGRLNFVLARPTTDLVAPEDLPENTQLMFFHEPDLLLQIANSMSDDVWLIGGEKTYKVFSDFVTELHVTLVQGHPKGDTFFPWNCYDQFVKEETDSPGLDNGIYYQYQTWRKHDRKN